MTLSFYFLFNHEMWRDEVESWLMVRDLPFENWRDYLRNSGHPGLFYLVLLPFVKSGFSIFSMQIINFIFTVLALGIFIFRSKIPDFIIFTLLFGSFFLYRYPVFARNYSIGLLLLFIFIFSISSKNYWNRILGYLSLILLVHTHLLFTLSAISWGLFLIIDSFYDNEKIHRKEKWIASFILFLSGLLLIYFLFPPGTSQWYGNNLFKNNPYAWKISLPFTFYPSFADLSIFYKITWAIIILWGVIFLKDIPIFITYVSGVALYLLFFRYVYVAHSNHLSVLFVFFISCISVFLNRANRKSSALYYSGLFLLFLSAFSQVLFLIKTDSKDLNLQFSGSKSAVDELIKCGWHEGDRIAAHSPFETKTILAYLPKNEKLFFPGLNDYGSHMLWGSAILKAHSMPEEEMIQIISSHPEINYLVWNQPLQINSDQLILCGKNQPELVIDPIEIFYIYKKR